MEPITRKEKFLARAGGQNIELPNPVTREEMFLAAIGGTSGGRGWVERKEVTFECDAAYDNELEGFPVFAVGDTVNVKVDGVEYSLVAFEDNGIPVIGDKPEQVMAGEGGEYGWFFALPEDRVVFVTIQNHTVSYVVDVVHKIDPKFLPDGYPYSVVPKIVANLDQFDNMGAVLSGYQNLYRLSDTVFTNQEQLYGLYIMGYVQPTYYIGENGVGRKYDYDFGTAKLSYSNIYYDVFDMNDDIGAKVGFRIVIDALGSQDYAPELCCIYKDCTINGTAITAGTYLNFASNSAPMPMVSLATGYETKVHRLASEYMPLLTDANGVKYKLTVSTSGALSAVKVDE